MFIPPIRNGDDLGVVYGSGFTTFDCATSVLPGTVYPWILVTDDKTWSCVLGASDQPLQQINFYLEWTGVPEHRCTLWLCQKIAIKHGSLIVDLKNSYQKWLIDS